MTAETTPNPGSDEAVAAGCRCPRMDNHHGRGYMGQPGVFAMNGGCPLHGEHTWGDELEGSES